MIVVKIPPNSYVVEEEKLELKCIVKGTKPSVSWEHRKFSFNSSTFEVTKPHKFTGLENMTKGNQVLEDNERIKLEEYNGVEDALLVIEKAELSDRGYYSCIGHNDLMEEPTHSESFVRVKDKLAALWPFIGICAEVFILCAIILIYEKRRNKTEIDESDTDQSPDQ